MSDQPNTMPDVQVLTITVVAIHSCGNQIVLHGDNWDDVHGVCVQCDEDYWLNFIIGEREEV